MKKIISAFILLSLVLTSTAFGAPSLNKDYIFSDGEYLYNFGSFDKSEAPDEVGVTINGSEYPLDADMLTWAKTNGKFGIGIKDTANTLGDAYDVTPYTKKDGVITSGEAITVAKNASIRNLKYHGPEDGVLDTTPYLGENLKTGTQIYTNMDVYLLNNLHAELKGEQYISVFNPNASTVSDEIRNDWSAGSMREWFSFDICKSAEIKVFTKDPFSGLTADKYGFTAKTTTDNGGYWFTLLHKDYPTADQTEFANMYSKTVTVSEGGCERISLPNLTTYGGLKHWGYFIVIDYADDEEIQPEITNLKYKGPEVDGVTYGVKLSHILESDKERFVYTNSNELSFNNVNESIAGNPYITMDNVKGSKYNSTIANAWLGGATDWITFDINSDATIKVITDGTAMDNCGGYKFTKATESVKYFDVYNNTWNSVNTEYTTMYYKNVEVEPGETVTVTIPNAPTWTSQAACKTAHVVVVDFEREYTPIINPEITNVKYAGPEVEGVTYGVELNHVLKDGTDNFVFANNNEVSFKNVDESIAGNPYIIMDNVKGSTYNSDVASAWFGTSRDWITFDINTNATIKVITDGVAMDNCSEYGFTKATDEITYFDAYLEEYKSNYSQYTTMYYKNIEVEADKTVTVKIPNAPTWTNQASCKSAHVVIIDFDEDYTPPAIVPEVTDIAFEGPAAEGVEYKIQLNESLANGNSAYTNTDNVFSNVDSSIAGKPYIIMDATRKSGYDSTIASAWFGSSRDWISFKINKSARIKIISDGDTLKYCTSYKFTKGDSLTYLNAGNEYNVMYYKDYEVEYGKTATVVIPNAPTWTNQASSKWPHIVVIDFVE